MRKNQKLGSLIKEVPQKKPVKKVNKVMLVLLFILIFVLTYLSITLFQIYNLKQQEKKLLEKQEQLKTEKMKLQNEWGQVNSPQYIEKMARSTLKMVKQGEILYVIPGVENKSTSPEAVNTDDN